MNDPQTQDQTQGDGSDGSMVTITMPTSLLDALIELLMAAKQKAQGDTQDNSQENDPSGLGDELSGSGRQPMQTVQR